MDDACHKCGAMRRIGQPCKSDCPTRRGGVDSAVGSMSRNRKSFKSMEDIATDHLQGDKPMDGTYSHNIKKESEALQYAANSSTYFIEKKAVNIQIGDEVINLGTVRGIGLVRQDVKKGTVTDKVCIKFTEDGKSNTIIVSHRKFS